MKIIKNYCLLFAAVLLLIGCGGKEKEEKNEGFSVERSKSTTEKAAETVRLLQKKYGELIFHQSGGCCDGSSPMIFEKDEMYLDESDVLLGQLENVNFYMNIDQFEYWKHTHLTIDITEGRGSSFSLEKDADSLVLWSSKPGK